MKNIIKAKLLSYQVGTRYLLRDISFPLAPKEHCVLFGMNGSGKTTLLSILSSFNSQTSGALFLFEEKLEENNVFAIRKNIGFVSSSFFDRFCKKEIVSNIILSGMSGTFISHGLPSRDEQELLFDWGGRLHITQLLDKPYFLLSKGEQQKILIARTLIGKPRLLLLDELYSGLDVLMRKELEDILQQETASHDLAIIQVTHRLEEIGDDFTKAILLRDGMIYAQGKRKDLFDPKIIDHFLQRRDGSLDTTVNGITTGSALDNSYDHDAECALRAGALTDLGFMGEEIQLYGVVWRDNNGIDRISVTPKQNSIVNFLERAKSDHLLVSQPCYYSKRFDIPVGRKNILKERFPIISPKNL